MPAKIRYFTVADEKPTVEEAIIKTLRDDKATFRPFDETRVDIRSGKNGIVVSVFGEGLSIGPGGELSGLVKSISVLSVSGKDVTPFALLQLEGQSEFLLSTLVNSMQGASGPINFQNYRAFFELIGRDGATTEGSRAADTVHAGAAVDKVTTKGGNDKISALTVSDIDAGKGNDLADLSAMQFGVVLSMNTGLFLDFGGSEGSIKGVEDAIGTRFDDQLTGDRKANDMDGGKGADDIVGLGGKDILKGGKGGDDLQGGNGADSLNGQGGGDVLNGGAGNDVKTGGKGADVFVFAAGDGDDVVTDFNKRADSIHLIGLTEDDIASITRSGDDTIVEIAPDSGPSSSIVFQDANIVLTMFDFM